MKEVTSSVESIEIEAEKILDEARTRAYEILLKAKEEAKVILSSQVSLDEVKAECDRIISKARVEAEENVVGSEKKASQSSIDADKKIEEIVGLLVSIVIGQK